MKLVNTAGLLAMLMVLTGCAAQAPVDPDAASRSSAAAKSPGQAIGDVNQLSLEEAMAKLEAAGVPYKVRVVGPEGTILTEPKAVSGKGKWKALGLLDGTSDSIVLSSEIRPGDGVKILVEPKIQPSFSPTATPTLATAATPTAAPTVTITYVITADGPISNTTFGNMVDGKMGQEQANDVSSPFTKEYVFTEEELSGAFDSFVVTAQAGEGATTISCQIMANGRELAKKQTSTGPYAVVMCSS